jgi:hypothetical protein
MFEQSTYSGRKEHTNSGNTRMSFRDATNPTLQRTTVGDVTKMGLFYRIVLNWEATYREDSY